MAIALPYYGQRTNGQTIDTSAGYTCAVCLSVQETQTVPTLNGVPMSTACANVNNSGIYYLNSPSGTYTIGNITNAVYFLLFTGTDGIRGGASASTAVATPSIVSIPSDYDDVILVVAQSTGGYTRSTKVNGSLVTYIVSYIYGYRITDSESAEITTTFDAGATLYYSYASLKSLVISDRSTFMTMF
jgi:hypothetical protein